MFRSPFHRLTHLGAEAGFSQGHRLVSNGLPIKPSGTGRRHLGLNGQIGTDRQGHSAMALRIVELPQFNDRAQRAIADGVEIGQLDVVGASIDTIDHGIGGALQFVVEAAINQPADHRVVQTLAGQYIVCRPALDAVFGQAAMDAFDDVAALTQLSQGDFGSLIHHPLSRPKLMGEAQSFQSA
ncbi:hypothetical protein GALL_244210 [mine drainage metagenome]|uniref:Uncharacterized protein n=1 Tax=mine drainage metagenome TaxID=410659 RepID=A0A1J5RZP9_9ZZZZ